MPKPRFGWYGQQVGKSFAVGEHWHLTSGLVLEILPWEDVDGLSKDTHVFCKVLEEPNMQLLKALCPKGFKGYWLKKTLEEFLDEDK